MVGLQVIPVQVQVQRETESFRLQVQSTDISNIRNNIHSDQRYSTIYHPCSEFITHNKEFDYSEMTECRYERDVTLPIKITPRKLDNDEVNDKSASSFRAKRKMGRSGSRSWFNRSFDQNVLLQSAKSGQHRTLRRQKSVTDFFQNMLSKSKLHLHDIFSLKKEKMKQNSKTTGDFEKQYHCPSPDIKAHANGAEGGMEHRPGESLNPTKKYNSAHSSCPNICANVDNLTRPVILKSHGSLNASSKLQEKRRYTEVINITSPTNLSSTLNMFLVTGSDTPESKDEEVLSNHKPIVKTSNRHFSISNVDIFHAKFRSSVMSSVSPGHGIMLQSPPLSSKKQWTPKIITTAKRTSAGELHEGAIITESAPLNRKSMNSSTFLLHAEDNASKIKRALVKSNSDTLAKLNLSHQNLAKASSDGNCFMKSSASSLASSMSSLGCVMISVTDYLFLGGIEAAYNEPLLCKYGISSLIDMSNVSPTLVPANKKSDCPCACSSKTHFRSKLNIGVDDIEWENLEPYFDDINAFIHGARKKGRRVLVFSYLGQSRAAAAVIQHIMQHFKIPYQKAVNIVRAKRPQIKLNSGFVKTLLRLERRLGLQHDCREPELAGREKRQEPPPAVDDCVEILDALSVPPVVRGAWLETRD